MTKISKAELAALSEETRLVAGGRDPAAFHGFVNTPVHRGSTILASSVAELRNHARPYTYARRGTPTSVGLEEAIIALDPCDGAVLCPSGLSAVTTALLSILSAGDHILVTDSAYGPTRHACDSVLSRLGIETTYYDPLIGAGIGDLFRPQTRAVYAEAPGSLSFEMQDLPAIAAQAHRRNAPVIVDNTWATPIFFPAHERGADLVVHAGTKYIGGHSDIMFGIVTAKGAAWPRLKAFHGDMGLCAGPDETFLAARGLRTLAVRLRHHEASALEVARWLAARPEVLRVLHPGLESDPGHAVWKRDFKGSSGLFSIVLRPSDEAAISRFLDGLKLFGLGYSWGGFESLAIPFDCAPQRTVTSWAPGGAGVRLHIGLEAVGDLVADLDAGLARYRGV